MNFLVGEQAGNGLSFEAYQYLEQRYNQDALIKTLLNPYFINLQKFDSGFTLGFRDSRIHQVI